MIKLRCDDGLILEFDDVRLQEAIHQGFLFNILGFKRESSNLYKLPGSVSAAQINQVKLYLDDYIKQGLLDEVEIEDSCQKILDQAEERRTEIIGNQEEAMHLKKLINSGSESIPDLQIPRLRDDVELKWYQKLSVLHTLCIGNSANFSVPGSGKTWMAYSSFFKMKDEQDIVDKLLIIGPKVAYTAWVKEYEKMTGEMPEMLRIAGDRSRRQQIFSNATELVSTPEIFFINYAMLSRELSNIIELLQKYRFLVIADESHHFKNIKSDRAQAIARITEHCTRKMILTGTMMPKELLDIYTQFDFLTTEQAILPNIDRFKMLYRNDDPGSNRILSELLNPFFFRVSKSRLNLPPQTFNPPTVIEMYPIQRRIYDVVANVVKRLDQQYRKDLVALNQWRRRALVFLIEAATDPSLLPHRNQFGLAITDETDDLDMLLADYENIETENPPRKLAKTIELTEQTLQNNEKVVIWCSFIKTIKKLEGLFADKDIQTRTIWGEVPADEEEDEDDNRPKRIDEWRESGDINVLIANPATLAESVSLHQECHHAIYVDRTFNGGHYMQSLERIHRVGLVPDTVTKYDIIQAELSIDQIISERLEFKRENMNRFLESADLAVMRFQDEANAANFANPIGEDRELDSDFAATMEHVKKNVPNI